MRCPRLCELPPAPAGKFGWPWTEETSALADQNENGILWPRISIVTPSYNQGQFLEETIRSVLLQGYPNLEYFVIDGGSTDNSVEIVRKYERWLTYWTSESDNGQAEAINNGLNRSSGEIVNWLNSDDLLYIGALKRVASAYVNDRTAALYNGSALRINSEGTYGMPYVASSLTPEVAFEGRVPLPQPAIFFKRESWLQHGPLKNFFYAMDTDLFFSCIMSAPTRVVGGAPLALMRVHNQAKTAMAGALRPMFLERFEIFARFDRNPQVPAHLKRYVKHGLTRESLRLAGVIAKDGNDWAQALMWIFRALRYSPSRALLRVPSVLLGHYHK
jgi:glycosyltransferase involved in cell wall biosynthesis